MIDEEKARAKRLAKKFINRKKLWKTYDSCICNLIENIYIRAYKQALHDKKEGYSENFNVLTKENAELKGELKALKEILEELKESYNAVIDEVIDTARGYGLVSDSALFCYINEYDNKEINYDELLDRIRNETIIELKLAIEDMKK